MDQEKYWLVRSSGRILGPFTLEEAGDFVRKKVITVIDEIRPPHQPWKLIREHKELMGLLTQDLNQLSEDTVSSETRTMEHTQTMTLTEQTVTGDLQAQEFTTTASDPNILAGVEEDGSKDASVTTESPPIKTIVASEKTVSWQPDSKPKEPTKAYVYSESPQLQNYVKKKQSQAKWFILGALVIVASILFALWAWEVKKQKDLIAQRYKQMEMARESYSKREYDRAIQLWEPLWGADTQLFKVTDKLHFVLLLIDTEKKLATAESILSQLERPTQPQEWLLWMKTKYTLALAKEQWEEALFIVNDLLLENYDPNYLLWKTQALLAANKLLEASDILLKSWLELSKNSLALDRAIFLSLHLMLKASTSGDENLKIKIDTLRTKVTEYTNNHATQFTPLYLFNYILWGLFKIEQKEDLATWVPNILGINTFEGKKFIFDPWDRLVLLDTDRMLPFCSQWFERLPLLATRPEDQVTWEDLAASAKVLCFYYFGDPNWENSIKEARNKRPQSNILSSLHANLLLLENRVAEGSALSDLCQSGSWCLLAKARACVAKKLSCAAQFSDDKNLEKQWGPFYYYFRAYLEQTKGNEFARKNYLKTGFKLYPQYLPFVEESL